jgi:glucose/arabinose dehydrogenase
VISPSGVTFYTGNIDEWKGNLFIGCLSGEHINRIVMKDNKVVGEESLLEDQNERFRDVLNGSDGNLYAVTDSGKLYKISKNNSFFRINKASEFQKPLFVMGYD